MDVSLNEISNNIGRHGGAAVRRGTRDRKGGWFDSWPGRYQVNSAFHPSGVGKSSNSLHGWC